MSRIPTRELTSYLLAGHLSSRGCLRFKHVLSRASPRIAAALLPTQARQVHRATSISEAIAASRPTPTPTEPMPESANVPLRKLLKEKAKASKEATKGRKKKTNAENQTVPGWELSVGIEIHAQLNTAHKLFSPAPNCAAQGATASSSSSGSPSRQPPGPNTLVSPFDLAIPGTQPIFQPATLIPAIRASLALNCAVQSQSRFDRKHYFHWDQPSGYQITQYYYPLALDGHIELRARDGIAAEDAGPDGKGSVRVRIKQVQMEQDTAKTLARPGGVQWLDFNRSGAPLVEIITQPDMHHPATAAALVRKVQMLMWAMDACVVGMEQGGLRADVNVSVRRAPGAGGEEPPLGQRTEIKNLFSFRAVEDAIIAERDRQIGILSGGGVVEGETRGWSLGSTETTRLRGKEGEVDYRYMPDPDLGPVVVGRDLVDHLRATMGVTPDEELDGLVEAYGLAERDALALMVLDGGGRVEFYYRVVDALDARIARETAATTGTPGARAATIADPLQPRILAANWILHVLGSLTSEKNLGRSLSTADLAVGSRGLEVTPSGDAFIRPSDLADILFLLHTRRIRSGTAKDLLFAVYNGTMPAGYLEASPSSPSASVVGGGGVERYISDNGLWFAELAEDEYVSLAEEVVDREEHVLGEFLNAKRYPQGKLMFLVGMVMKSGPGERLDPLTVQRVVREVVDRRVAALKQEMGVEG